MAALSCPGFGCGAPGGDFSVWDVDRLALPALGSPHYRPGGPLCGRGAFAVDFPPLPPWDCLSGGRLAWVVAGAFLVLLSGGAVCVLPHLRRGLQGRSEGTPPRAFDDVKGA